MFTYDQVEPALTKLGYFVDFNFRHHSKLTSLIPVDGYESPVVLEFREGWTSTLGDVEQLLQVEWLMEDSESSLVLDINSIDEIDETPDLFTKEKLILREIFDQVLAAIAKENHPPQI